jgi:DNA-directed RNA polymerase subunit RPC12/RpoP
VAVCSECEAEIDVDEFDVERDDELSCSACGANFVVKAVSPVEIEIVVALDVEFIDIDFCFAFATYGHSEFDPT